jgi:hypothetical protein
MSGMASTTTPARTPGGLRRWCRTRSRRGAHTLSARLRQQRDREQAHCGGGGETHVSSLAPCEPPLAYFQLCAKEAVVNRRALGGVHGLAPELALFRLAHPLENLPRSVRSEPLSGMRGKNAPQGSARTRTSHSAGLPADAHHHRALGDPALLPLVHRRVVAHVVELGLPLHLTGRHIHPPPLPLCQPSGGNPTILTYRKNVLIVFLFKKNKTIGQLIALLSGEGEVRMDVGGFCEGVVLTVWCASVIGVLCGPRQFGGTQCWSA